MYSRYYSRTISNQNTTKNVAKRTLSMTVASEVEVLGGFQQPPPPTNKFSNPIKFWKDLL